MIEKYHGYTQEESKKAYESNVRYTEKVAKYVAKDNELLLRI